MPLKLMMSLRNAFRRLRWIGGRGWRAQDFAARYATLAPDVWGYRASPEHERRAEWILSALPEGRFRRVLEAGCAQGFLTERLATRSQALVACDFSPEAIAEAKRRLAGAPHVDCRVADIRDGFPGADFDVCLFSDVLYYLSKREIDSVLAEAAKKISAGGLLLIANEWRAAAPGLTDPDYGCARLEASPNWRRLARNSRPFGQGEFRLALFRRADESGAPL